jgi:hypothetical protein
MRHYLPGRTEILVFAVLALVCAAVVATGGAHDAGLSIAAFPIFVFSAILGLWKHGRLRSVDEEV